MKRISVREKEEIVVNYILVLVVRFPKKNRCYGNIKFKII